MMLARNQVLLQKIKMTMETKLSLLNVVAGHATVINSNFIMKQAMSLEMIWERLRGLYGFRRTVLKLTDIKMGLNESRVIVGALLWVCGGSVAYKEWSSQTRECKS